MREPELIDLGSDFRVNLYRMKTEVDQFGVIKPKQSNNVGTNGTNVGTNGTNVGTDGTDVGTDGTNVGTDEDRILDLVRLDSRMRQKEIHEKTGIPLRTVKRIMAALQQEGKLERKGSNRTGEWIIKY